MCGDDFGFVACMSHIALGLPNFCNVLTDLMSTIGCWRGSLLALGFVNIEGNHVGMSVAMLAPIATSLAKTTRL